MKQEMRSNTSKLSIDAMNGHMACLLQDNDRLRSKMRSIAMQILQNEKKIEDVERKINIEKQFV